MKDFNGTRFGTFYDKEDYHNFLAECGTDSKIIKFINHIKGYKHLVIYSPIINITYLSGSTVTTKTLSCSSYQLMDDNFDYFDETKFHLIYFASVNNALVVRCIQIPIEEYELYLGAVWDEMNMEFIREEKIKKLLGED